MLRTDKNYIKNYDYKRILNLAPDIKIYKEMVSDLFNEFADLIQGTAENLMKFSKALKNAQETLQERSSIENETFLQEGSKSIEKNIEKIAEISQDEEPLDDVRVEVPKLLNQVKELMGSDAENNFETMNPIERKRALKDMEKVILILTKEYKKVADAPPPS